MKLIEVIPIGKEHKKTRQELMYSAKIIDIREFKQEISKLKERYIIIFDNGYYLPASKEEYMEFIEKQKEQLNNTTKTIELAYKEMERL